MKKHKISSEQREFFQSVAHATFSNPFSDQRKELDRRISGMMVQTQPPELKEVLDGIKSQIKKLEAAGAGHLDHFALQDRQVIKYTFLFELFHDFLPRFDRLIQDQLQKGDDPCPVEFSGELLQQLRLRGFSPEECDYCIALFFQLRRAYYFIDQRISGQSPSMRALRCSLWNNVFTADIVAYERILCDHMEDFSTLVLGETGTGKGTAATAIGMSGFIPFDRKQHRFRQSFTRAFVPINLAEYPESLIESALFGHKKGAFTGAVEKHDGILSRCSRYGAIFLDEIGEMGVPVQVKLLQVLQERFFCPVASYEQQRFSGRIIAATNKDVNAMRRQGKLRDDFFYRLCSDIIELPPLRRRISEDSAELSRLVHRSITKITGAEDVRMARNVLAVIERDIGFSYPWPGNVRELEQCVRRIMIKGEYKGDGRGLNTDSSKIRMPANVDARQLLASYCRQLYERWGSYEQVSRITRLDRRTVKKYIQNTHQAIEEGD